MKILYREISQWKYQLAGGLTLKTDIRPAGGFAICTDWIQLSRDGMLGISPGYSWDGPSGPAIDTKNFMRGSLVHDAFYQLIRMGLLPEDRRAAADRLLYRLVLEDGMSRVRALWVLTALRSFGWAACKPRPYDRAVICEAP